ncbi:cytochrome-c oxidase, cbb3-type subunit III [Elongatibacter sediminis]|uniref:Cbb3-type cytochrome c oxidase subunit n=1 Tax=Elongatibacter sediminis TaxID=3119006 RepID=A0AAW9RDL1_9GAMM
MLNAFWHWFVIVGTIASILACWWLLHWTKGVSGRKGNEVGSTGHVWDEDLIELNAPLPRWWLHLFNLTIIFALAYLVFYPGLGNIDGILGWTQVQQLEQELEQADARQQEVFERFTDMRPEELIADAEAVGIGRRLFGNYCAMCHGSDGRGAPGFPNLTDDAWLYGNSWEQVATSIRDGRAGVMPPMGAALGEEGVLETVVYVQQLSGQKADPGLAAAGKQRYDTLCVACHGPDGTGNPMLGAPNLTDDAWLYGGTPAVLTETITNGRNGNMPAHRDLLSEERRRLVAAYVLSLSADTGD